jgi:hypothetical protein
MSVIIIATARPLPEYRDKVVATFEAAVASVHEHDDGCELSGPLDVQVLRPHPAGTATQGTL